MLPAAPNAPVTWCGGLKVTGFRLPDADDCERARRFIRRHRRIGMTAALSIPIAIVLSIGLLFATNSILQMFRENSRGWHLAGYVSCGIATLIGIAAIAFTVFSQRYFRDAARLEKEIGHGRIAMCEGPVALAQPVVAYAARPAQHIKIEVFANSGLLWTVNGKPDAHWIFVAVGHAAPAVPAGAYAQPGSTRTLAVAELAELREYIAPVTARVIALAGVWNVAMIVVVAAVVILRPDRLADLLFACAVILAALAYDRRFFTRRALQKDLAARIVTGAISGAGPVEILPQSKRIWTINGSPAAWRRAGQRLFPGTKDDVTS